MIKSGCYLKVERYLKMVVYRINLGTLMTRNDANRTIMVYLDMQGLTAILDGTLMCEWIWVAAVTFFLRKKCASDYFKDGRCLEQILIWYGPPGEIKNSILRDFLGLSE